MMTFVADIILKNNSSFELAEEELKELFSRTKHFQFEKIINLHGPAGGAAEVQVSTRMKFKDDISAIETMFDEIEN